MFATMGYSTASRDSIIAYIIAFSLFSRFRNVRIKKRNDRRIDRSGEMRAAKTIRPRPYSKYQTVFTFSVLLPERLTAWGPSPAVLHLRHSVNRDSPESHPRTVLIPKWGNLRVLLLRQTFRSFSWAFRLSDSVVPLPYHLRQHLSTFGEQFSDFPNFSTGKEESLSKFHREK